jgi:uncharacterized protein (TIGR04255 family)
MSTPIRFPRAPITEALLDIHVKLPSQINLTRLANLHDAVKDRYPSKRERVSWQGGFQITPGTGPAVLPPSGGPDGYLFTSADGRQIVQARLEGFTFNRLKPYDKWETFRDEAKELWQRYVQIASPEVVTRLALRYINRIEIPLPMKDFKEYILTTPEITPELPQGLGSFFMRLVIPEPKTQAVAVVTETMEPIADPSKALPLIFDIDVFRQAAFDIDDRIWETFESLRNLKNDIFFKSLTPKAKELFL